jgi:hypothetical protein
VDVVAAPLASNAAAPVVAADFCADMLLLLLLLMVVVVVVVVRCQDSTNRLVIKFKAPEGKGGQLLVYVIPGKAPKVRTMCQQ